jgi:site-specific DNA-methyltransferase (adenine-specific)
MSVWAIHEGDCANVMRTLAPQSVDAVITSPPYAMQRKTTYGGIPETDYPAWTVAWMSEVRRLLKPDGSVIINIRPHIRNGQISDYTLRTRLALREDGWTEVDELIWHKPNGMPTGSPRKPRRSWESLHWFALHGQPWSDAKANGRPSQWATNVQSASASQRGWSHATVGGLTTPAIARCGDVATIQTKEHVGDFKHPAKFPVALAEWMARLTCPPGGTVLDPFNGSGSTGVAAIRNGYSYIGIDAVAEYVAMSRARLEAS